MESRSILELLDEGILESEKAFGVRPIAIAINREAWPYFAAEVREKMVLTYQTTTPLTIDTYLGIPILRSISQDYVSFVFENEIELTAQRTV